MKDSNVLYRDVVLQLEDWFSTPSRSPLVIFGPRQVGKSFLLKNFAKKKFSSDQIIEINFLKDNEANNSPGQFSSVFKQTQDPQKIINLLGLIAKKTINPDEHILIMDEIQECPEAYSSLKLFKEEYPHFPIMTTGSYLKLFLDQEKIIRHPVGCAEELCLNPLSFSEFLINYDKRLFDFYEEINIHTDKMINETVHQSLLTAMEIYFFTGGMPEVVHNFLLLYENDLNKAVRISVRKQKSLLGQYRRDLSKYAKSNREAKKIKIIFDEIPHYLNQDYYDEVPKFSLSEIEKGKQFRYRELKSSFDYLQSCGQIIRTNITNDPALPFSAHIHDENRNSFKCFMFDIGLLNNALGTPFYALQNNHDMGHYKGYIAENFVAQQLYKKLESKNLYSYKKHSNANSAEVEFIVSINENIVPIEVKSSKKSKKAKSLNSYISEFKPALAYKVSPGNLGKGVGFYSIPLYLIEKIMG